MQRPGGYTRTSSSLSRNRAEALSPPWLRVAQGGGEEVSRACEHHLIAEHCSTALGGPEVCSEGGEGKRKRAQGTLGSSFESGEPVKESQAVFLEHACLTAPAPWDFIQAGVCHKAGVLESQLISGSERLPYQVHSLNQQIL